MNDWKTILMGIVSSIILMLNPIKDFVVGMLIVFTLNYLAGWTADRVTGGSWSMKKTFSFGKQCFVFFGIIVFIFVTGHFLHKGDEALIGVQYVCIIAVWAYSRNILRNLRDHILEKGTTMWQLVDILYWIISFEIIEKLPAVKKYLEKKDKEYQEERANETD